MDFESIHEMSLKKINFILDVYYNYVKKAPINFDFI